MTTAIRTFVIISLFLCTLQASNLINNGRANAQEAQVVCDSILSMHAISSAGTFEILLDIEPFPIETERPTMLNLTFIRLAEPAVIQLNVGFDVFILDENDNVIFRASNQSRHEQDILYSADGTALIPYKFESAGSYTVHIRILQVNFIPIQPEFVAFPIVVVSQFGSPCNVHVQNSLGVIKE